MVLIIAGLIGFDYIEEQNKVTANLAFNKFLENNSDEIALSVLKEKNKNLYEIAMHIKDESYIPEVAIFKEIALFQKAIKDGDIDSLNTLISTNSFLLKEYAMVFKALQEIKK